MIEFLRFGSREDPKRKDRLVQIRRSIEASYRYEEEAMSHPVNASTLKRVYNIDSLWIVQGESVRKLGSANYSRELNVFRELKEKYASMQSMRIHRGGERYYVLESNDTIYLFSTPLELTTNEIILMLGEIEDALPEKKVFLNNSINITQDGR